MLINPDKKFGTVLFLPHGGGPLPLLGDKNHEDMVRFLKEITPTLGKPSAIVVISAHWEEDIVTMTSGKTPQLIYDYSGFPEESYNIKYPAPGNPELANKIYKLLETSGIDVRLDSNRGFDHGVFVPLKIMFPEANIPCIQISQLRNLEPEAHIKIGNALSGLQNENVLIIGSGLSFHNMKAFFSHTAAELDEKNEAFENWLIDTCTNTAIPEKERANTLVNWSDAPYARYCHPREEHLLPLLVCYGASGSAAQLVYSGKVIGKRTSAFLW